MIVSQRSPVFIRRLIRVLFLLGVAQFLVGFSWREKEPEQQSVEVTKVVVTLPKELTQNRLWALDYPAVYQTITKLIQDSIVYPVRESDYADLPKESLIIVGEQKGRYLSLVSHYYGYFGGAHGLPSSIRVVVDTQKHKPIVLKDLVEFRLQQDFVDFCKDYVYRELQVKLGETHQVAQGFKSEAGTNFMKKWSLSEEGIVFYFDVYTLTSYAGGPQTVVVPWDTVCREFPSIRKSLL